MSVKYIKFMLCDGCSACIQTLPDGQTVRQEHVIGREDVTAQVRNRLLLPQYEVTDVGAK